MSNVTFIHGNEDSIYISPPEDINKVPQPESQKDLPSLLLPVILGSAALFAYEFLT